MLFIRYLVVSLVLVRFIMLQITLKTTLTMLQLSIIRFERLIKNELN